MRALLVLALVGFFAGSSSAQTVRQPWATSAAFPTVTPPGWYTNTYWYDWFYPWYAYYNYSNGPYSNWAAGRGYAVYGYRVATVPVPPSALPAEVIISLPPDAQLLISGAPVAGTGVIRTFATPVLTVNQEYGYEMAAEVMIGGQIVRATKVVPVHAGEKVTVNFEPGDFAPMKK